jgi:hypothetical protein
MTLIYANHLEFDLNEFLHLPKTRPSPSANDREPAAWRSPSHKIINLFRKGGGYQ